MLPFEWGSKTFLPGVPKKYADMVGSMDVNLALINSQSFSNYSSIVNLNIGIWFTGIRAWRAEILIVKTQTSAQL